jgi:hypothetical protein
MRSHPHTFRRSAWLDYSFVSLSDAKKHEADRIEMRRTATLKTV